MTIEKIENIAFAADENDVVQIRIALEQAGLHHLANYIETLIEDRSDWIDPENFDGQVGDDWWIHPDNLHDEICDRGYINQENSREFLCFWSDFESEIREKTIGRSTYCIADKDAVDRLMSKYHELLD